MHKLKFLDGTIDQRLLHDAKLEGQLRQWMIRNHEASCPVFCLCNGEEAPIKMSVVFARSEYFLRRYKGTDTHHSRDCDFAGAVQRTGIQSHVPGVEEVEGGGYKLHLGPDVFPTKSEIQTKTAGIGTPTEADLRGRRNSVGHGTVTLLGILQLLLEKSGTADWIPEYHGERNLEGLFWQMKHFALECAFGRSQCLGENIIWPLGSEVTEQILHARLIGDDPRNKGPREILAVGQFLRVELSKSGLAYKLYFDRFRTPILCELETFDDLLRRFPRLTFNQNGEVKHGVIALMTLRRAVAANGNAWVFLANLAPMILSRDFIPCESSYEVRCAEQLVDQGRMFYKPMRYDGESEMHPDFVLSDTSPKTNCEVWGRSDDEYLTRKAEKIKRCARDGIPLWQWDASVHEQPPPFPPRSQCR